MSEPEGVYECNARISLPARCNSHYFIGSTNASIAESKPDGGNKVAEGGKAQEGAKETLNGAHSQPRARRNTKTRPVLKLSVQLIDTYKFINKVGGLMGALILFVGVDLTYLSSGVLRAEKEAPAR